MELSSEARNVIGWIIITIPTIEFGGGFLLYRLRTQSGGRLQSSYFRAGHAHAGVLVILAILGQMLVDVAGYTAPAAPALRVGFFLAPILVSAGFFLGAPSGDSPKPGRLIGLVYIGAVVLALSAVGLGVGLVFG